MDSSEELSGELAEISKMHYEVLLFGYKIAEGLRNGVSTDRLKAYADWFLDHYLKPHIKMEEKYVFSILGLQNIRVKRALANHRRLLRLFENEDEVYRSINRIEDEIGSFIRFEDRVLLKQIQDRATAQELAEIKKQHEAISYPEEEWIDKFWEEG